MMEHANKLSSFQANDFDVKLHMKKMRPQGI